MDTPFMFIMTMEVFQELNEEKKKFSKMEIYEKYINLI